MPSLTDNSLVDIIISLILVYALLSVLVSILIEWWSHYSKMRGKQLKQAIFQLLNDQSFNYQYGELFYNHISISGLRNERTLRPPQYISANLFADVLIDIIANQKLHDHPIHLIDKDHAQGKQYELVGTATTKKLQERFTDSLASMKIFYNRFTTRLMVTTLS
jgi:predicted restriction endonuclease